MAGKYYEIKVPITSKEEIKKFKDSFSDLFKEKISPDMSKAVRDVMVFHNIEPGTTRDWSSFRAANAGIVSAAILDNINKRFIKTGKGTFSNVRVERSGNISEVIITGEVDTEAAKELNVEPEAVIKMIAGLTPARVKQIFDESTRKAGYD